MVKNACGQKSIEGWYFGLNFCSTFVSRQKWKKEKTKSIFNLVNKLLLVPLA